MRRARRWRPSWSAILQDPALLAELAARSDVAHLRLGEYSGQRAGASRENRPESARRERRSRRRKIASPKRRCFPRCKIPVAAHAAIDSKEQLIRGSAANIGLPGVLKTRRLGYDGKGQFVLRDAAHIDAAWAAIGGPGLIYEKFQAFSREVSIVGARSAAGQTRLLSPVRQYPRRRHFALQHRALIECRISSARARTVFEAGHGRARLRRSACHRILRGQRTLDRQ